MYASSGTKRTEAHLETIVLIKNGMMHNGGQTIVFNLGRIHEC